MKAQENLFFDVGELKKCGRNVIIGRTVRIRYPELVEIGNDVIIDDFTYISTGLTIDNYVHIAAGCKLIGGARARISIGSFSSFAPNVVLAAGSDDYVGGLASPLVPLRYKGRVEVGSIEVGRHCIVGANSTVLPNVICADGAALGAQSLVNADLEAWSLYAGVPARLIRSRDKDAVLRLEIEFMNEVGS